jgi:hypothetical protein
VSAVRRSCHTIARWIGAPVFRSQTTVVSRWFVIPIAASASRVTFVTFAARSAPVTACSTDVQISAGSCSTHAGFGKYCGNSTVWRPSVSPSSETTSAVVPVVPWSMARRCLAGGMGRG